MAGTTKVNIPKDRILREAEVLFARRGFYAVTVREITQAAHCNLASVNYHFGNKKNLYMEVFRCLWKPRARRIQTRFENVLAAQKGMTLQGIVQAVAEAFIKGPLSDEERLRHFQLWVREMARPTDAFEMVVGEVIGPFQRKLTELIRPFMAREMGQVALLLHIQSIISMVIHFNFARNPVMRVTGRQYDDRFKDQLVKHLVQFSLSGMNGAGEGGIP